MPELQRLRAAHGPAVLAFELANRDYFAASISDRGDEFFSQFAERFAALLATQDAGADAYYVLVAADGSVLGRFNLYFTGDGTANLGYRVAQHAAGRGVATATVLQMCELAVTQHGIRTLRAATATENAASQRVLIKAGFILAGPADPADIGGKPGFWYERDLAPAETTGRATTPVIRPAEVSDAAQIGLIHVRSWQSAYRGKIPQDHLDGLDPAERGGRWRRTLQAIDRSRAGVLVADSGTGIVGFAGYGPCRDEDAHPDQTGQLAVIYLLPQAWGRGTGRELLAAAVGGLAALGYVEATLWVLDSNDRARRFYEKAGWAEDGVTRVDDSLGSTLNEVRYRLRLRSR